MIAIREEGGVGKGDLGVVVVADEGKVMLEPSKSLLAGGIEEGGSKE